MFDKFMNDNNCMKILLWLINHSTGDYDAAIIAYDCQIMDITLFIYLMSLVF